MFTCVAHYIVMLICWWHFNKQLPLPLPYTICGAVCFQFTHFLCDDWENIYIYIYTLSYYHHQIGSMNYYPLFRVRSWNNGMRCMSFYILIFIKIYARFGKIGFIQCSVDLGISIDISTWAYASRRWLLSLFANPTSMIIRGAFDVQIFMN